MSETPRPPEFDFPLSWSGPDGIGASPFDEFAEDEGPDVDCSDGQEVAVALRRTLVGLELEGSETAGHGDEVWDGRRRVGVVTSGTRSPTLRKNVALCRMAVQYSELGTAVEVGKLDGLQKRIPAQVVRFPFYDPEKKRPRS